MPNDTDYDEFQGTSGLVDDYDGEITDAYFSTDANYNNGQTLCLHLEVATDDTSNPEVTNLYPCGPDWASYDDGATAEHPKGEKQRFNGNTKIMKLITAAMKSGAEDEMRRRSREEFAGVGHRHAALWKGLKFHWNVQTEHVSFTDKLGNKVERDTNVIVPTEFLGIVGETGSSTPTTPASSTGTAAATNSVRTAQDASTTSPASTTTSSPGNGVEAGATDDPLSTLDAESAAKLRLLAKTQPYPEFLDSALEIPGLVTNNAVVSKLGEESFYESLKA